MWLKVSLCVSLVWLLVGRAGGSGSPGTCKGAQDLYVAVSSAYTSEQLNAVSINPAGKIFDEPSGGVVDGVCQLQSTCCSKEAEELLRLSVGDRYHVNIINLLSDEVLSCHNSSLKSTMAQYFSDSRDSLVATMKAAYGSYFEPYVDIFNDFYNYLSDAMYTGSTCEIENEFMQVNFDVFLAAFLCGDSGPQFVELLKSPLYRSCFYDNFIDLYSSELGLTYNFRHFTYIFNQTMHYLRALYISDHVTESILSHGLTKQCRNAILKMTYCSQCAGYSSPATCSGLCLNTMRGCLVDLSDLVKPFQKFTQAVIWMKEQLEPIIYQFTLIHVHFLNVIHFVNIERQAISTEMQSRCDINGRIGRSAPSKRGANMVSPATLLPPSLQFNESAYCLVQLQSTFSHLPELVCEGEEEVSEGNENCWNGRLVGSYDREVENYTRKAQKNNPEVLLCVSREPRYRKEISLLQYITQDLNSLTYKDVCSYDDEDCTVDLTDICEYYQLPQIREDSFDPTLFFSGDLEFEQQADACEDNTTAGLPTANCTEGSVRQINGSRTRGRLLEVCFDETWGSVCLFSNGSFGPREAAVVCRQLGLPFLGAQASRAFTNGTIVVNEVQCDGTESSIDQCTLTAPGRSPGCSRSEVVGVICGNASNCTDGDVRIAERPFSPLGLVEICLGGEWGPVCDDSSIWGQQEAAVVCRQLGFQGFLSSTTLSFDFSLGFLTNVNCNGTESRLLECGSSGFGVSVCRGNRVEAECFGRPPCRPDEFDCPFGRNTNPCIPETWLCDGFLDCIGGSDEQNCPDRIAIGFTPSEFSVYEGRHSTLSFCLRALNGSFVQPIEVTIQSIEDRDSFSYDFTGTAKSGIDYNNFTGIITFSPGQNISCYTVNSSTITIDDRLLEFTEYFRVIALPTDFDDRFVTVDERFNIATLFITDNEIVQVGFESPVYSVSEGDGEVTVSVTWFGNGVELGRPVTVRVSNSGGNATGGTDYEDQGVLPQIAYLAAHSPPSQTWDISIPVIDDSDVEGPEAFTLHIFSSDLGVIVMQDTAIVIIADNDGSRPVDLEVFFTGDTPRLEGNTQINTVTFQVETNKPASVRCREPSEGNIACSPGEISTIANLTSGTYTIRAIARSGSERTLAAVTFVIPEDDETCTVHLINRGVTVRGDAATIEFGGFMIGRVTGYSCQLDSQPSMPCTSPLVLNGLSVGRHQIQVTPQGCGANRPLTETFIV